MYTYDVLTQPLVKVTRLIWEILDGRIKLPVRVKKNGTINQREVTRSTKQIH